MSATVYRSNSSPWIINSRKDIAFIFGGAAASLFVPLLVIWKVELLPIVFWSWLFFFDGTHSWATYSRTFIDRKFWKTNRRLLLVSLLWFALPLLAVVLKSILNSMDPIYAFLMFVQFWSYYHIVRQHYGYVSIYDRKTKVDRFSHLVNKWTIYIGLWTPYFFFLITHPINHKIAQLSASGWQSALLALVADGGKLNQIVVIAATTLSSTVSLFFICYHVRRRYREGGSYGPTIFFVIACLAVYSIIFYVVAPLEPLLPAARTPVQSFMLIQVMITLFHNIQYHAIVWHYNSRKYKQKEENISEYGLAASFNRNLGVYFLTGLVFSLGYIAAAWYTTEYPSYQGKIPETLFVPVAFCIWWGLAMNHYYLDQNIWRVSKTKELQDRLGIAN
jgi:hypothetical protein